MYDNPGTGPQPGQGTFSVDISTDNGTTWINDIWLRSGNQEINEQNCYRLK